MEIKINMAVSNVISLSVDAVCWDEQRGSLCNVLLGTESASRTACQVNWRSSLGNSRR